MHDPEPEESRFAEPGAAAPAGPPATRGGLPVSRPGRALAIGCGVVLAGLLGLSLYFYANWQSFLAASFRTQIAPVIAHSSLSDAEKERVRKVIDRVLDRLAAGELDRETFARLVGAFNDSPLSRAFLVLALRGRYLAASKLTDDEKHAAEATLDRLVRGILERKIDDDGLAPLRRQLPQTADGKAVDPKATLDDGPLRLLLADVEELVAGRGIPAGDYEPPIAAELEAIVDGVIGAPDPPR